METEALPAETLDMIVRIRRADCCGHGQCAEIAPAVFAVDRHKAVVLDPEAVPREVVLEAVESCPCGAIEIEEDEEDLAPPAAAAGA